jgi:hypothetical protein
MRVAHLFLRRADSHDRMGQICTLLGQARGKMNSRFARVDMCVVGRLKATGKMGRGFNQVMALDRVEREVFRLSIEASFSSRG